MASNTDLVRNSAPNFATTLANSMLSTDTSMTLQSTTGLPTGTGISLTIDATSPVTGLPTPTLEETVTGVVSSSTVVSLLRGRDSTTAQAHASGANVVMYVTSTMWNDFQTAYLTSHNQAGGIIASSPEITTSINDSNNNEIIALSPTSSAVNELQVANASTGNDVIVSVAGSDTNISLDLQGKGSGSVKLMKWLYNPYKFSVYRNSAINTSSSLALLTFDTEIFDTSSNYSVSTGRFTAPIAGFYQINAKYSVDLIANAFAAMAIFKNGSIFDNAVTGINNGSTNVLGSSFSEVIELAANDYLQVYIASNGTYGVEVGAAPYQTTFSGFLVSAT